MLLSSVWLMLLAPGLQVLLLMFSSYLSESFKLGQAVAAPVGRT